ncbi:MAG: hypothetical protein ABSA03_19525, partial [Streptosporangiaceae bacterium]
EALLAEAELAAGADRRLDQAATLLRRSLGAAAAALTAGEPAGREAEFLARRLAGLIALVLQAGLLVTRAPAAVADAFCGSRLDPAAAGGVSGPGLPFGMLPGGTDLTAILGRAQADAAR